MQKNRTLLLAVGVLALIGLVTLSAQLFAQEATPEVTPVVEVTSEVTFQAVPLTPTTQIEQPTMLPPIVELVSQTPTYIQSTTQSLTAPNTRSERPGHSGELTWISHPAVFERPLRIAYVISATASVRDNTLLAEAALNAAADYSSVDL
ncbi:MAG: hypothetical protein SF029_06765, partial [bacterium]|nr:hypothetical protein [bacterium]